MELRHCVTDADGVSPSRDLIIERDDHGLTIEFPNGSFLTVDLSKSVFTIYLNDDPDDIGRAICWIKN